MEYQASDRKRAIEELVRGREFANQLVQQLLVNKTSGGGDDEEQGSTVLPFAEDLARKILRSFTNTLQLLDGNGEASAIKMSDSDSSSPNREDLEASCKCCIIPDRERYKRRRTSPTWVKDSSILIDDGHAWRKYGQKVILNAKYLRSYFRCSHKYDEGCNATKQVQRIQEDPPLYRTTYYGHHTCNVNLANNPDIILDCTSPSCSSMTLINFDESLPNYKQNHTFFSSSSFSFEKLELEEVVPDVIM